MEEEFKHIVYICFDNKDLLISSFIDYLRVSFNSHGISEHIDDNSNRFVDLIRVLVVVFSKNYKFFVPENLVNHVNDNKDVMAVSVLHGVTVSSVIQQIKVLEPWLRVKLESAIWLGHAYNDIQSAQFMEEIARDVFEKLYPTEEIGINKLQVQIENLLCKQQWGLRTLGIYGEVGIGKTTLARAVFRRMSSAYDASCFIKDFNKEYSQNRLRRLSNEYLSETPVERFDLNDSALEPSYRRKRVLIVLDDVQNFKEAKSFLGGGFGPGSFIIITSRDKEVLDQFDVNETYELEGLNQEDAMKLFTRCAFGKDVIDQNLSELSKKEIQSANGNPLAIRSKAKKRKVKQASTNTQDIVWYSCSDVEHNTSMSNEEDVDESQVWYSSCDIEFPSSHNSILVHLNDLGIGRVWDF